MRRHLRKKGRLGEFREFGFELAFSLPAELSESQVLGFGDEFFDHVESRNLMVGGASGHRWDLLVTPAGRGSATEGDREEIRAWLERHSLVSEVRVGELIDVWHAA
jgi:uncharacterized protein YggL (DUF469 family)